MIVLTWLYPWYRTEAVEKQIEHPSYETKHPKSYKTWKIWILILCLKWQILYLTSGSHNMKEHKQMNDLQVVWVGHDTSEFCAFHFIVFMCVYTRPCRCPWRAAEGFGSPQSYRWLWTSWGSWELNTSPMPEQQVFLTTETSHWPSLEFQLGCHPQAVSFM